MNDKHRFFIARDAWDVDTFHLIMEQHFSGGRKHDYHVAALFEEHLDYLTADHIDIDPGTGNVFINRVKSLCKGERIEVGLSLWIAEDD